MSFRLGNSGFWGFGTALGSGSVEPPVTLVTPTWSDNFNSYADGTRLVAGDPNANYGLGATNPGNLGWDALTTVAPTNARFNPVVHGGVTRFRTANAVTGATDIGSYVLAPAATQSGAMYGQMTIPATFANFNNPTLAILATNETSYLGLQPETSTTGTAPIRLVRKDGAAAESTLMTASPFSTKVRVGGSSGQFRPLTATETFTLLAVSNRAYVRRGPGFPVGPTGGTAFTALSGNRVAIGSRSVRHERFNSFRYGAAPLFITVNETHRHWVPKKRASASEPITAGVGDETFTGTYVGTIPSKMQWALFNMGTGAVIKDWATVPAGDFTASGGTWSARLRAIPAGLNGRGAYAVGFRPVNASNETDPAWQCISNREFYVTLNVGLIGQSNAVFLALNQTTGTQYPRVDGLMPYTKLDPPSVVQGTYIPAPAFWDDTTSGASLNTRGYYLLGDYLANLYNLPISFEVLAISATGALNLGPGGANWSYIQTHHGFAGGAYDILYLSQGENEFASAPGDWLTTWVNTNLPAYRDPAFHGQPAGTVIPLLYAITGRFTGTPGANTDANAQTLRAAQYSLESSVPDCYLAHSYTGVEMIDTFHYVSTNGEGYNEVARRIRLTYDKVFNGGAYDGRGPIATSASRSGAVITVSFDLNGATSLVARDGRDQTLAGNDSALTSWQVSADNFATLLTISSAVISGNTVVITLASDPGGPVRVRNHFGLNPDISSFPAGSYADGTFICMMPLVNSLLTPS